MSEESGNCQREVEGDIKIEEVQQKFGQEKGKPQKIEENTMRSDYQNEVLSREE